jgi:glycosyltransferase involved in cell wall biosynthesis
MKNVLMIVFSLAKGGMQRQLSLYLKNFDRSKIKVTLAMFRNEIDYEIPNDVEIIDLKRGKKDIAFFFRFYKLLKKGKYDVINSKISYINEHILAYSKFMKLPPIIMEIRNSGEFQIPYYRIMKLLSDKKNNHWPIICNSNKAYNEVATIFPDREVALIKNGVDTDIFKKTARVMSSKFKISFVGRLNPDKNIETIIKATSLLNLETKANISIELVGNPVSEDYLRSLELLISEYNLEELFKIIPPKDNIWDYYNEIDLLVLPSFFEGTPNVLLEAMSCEVPCLISKGANSDDFLKNEFVFETLDFNSLASKIEQLYKMDFDKKEEIGKENRNFVIENYSVKSMVEKLTHIIITRN